MKIGLSSMIRVRWMVSSSWAGSSLKPGATIVGTRNGATTQRTAETPMSERISTFMTLDGSAARNAVRVARDAIEKGGEAAESAVAEASSILDRAAKRGAIHKNAARRGRSRIAKRANKATKKKA